MASGLYSPGENLFGYHPWCQDRRFSAMFDILEADIVVMQETKIQRKDLHDDMVLVPGWDAFFSLPKYKKGYSGVVIYTRNSICAPIRAEEGITGILTPPNSFVSFRDPANELQIGGYPTTRQLSDLSQDASTIDSEGRCLILEFPAFILIGTYCPAIRDESRNEYRLNFLRALDIRVRNLVKAGKRVLLAGDLNIVREEIDSAYAEEQMRKQCISHNEFLSDPARRIFNQLLIDGKVIGNRDLGREKPIMWDICRSFNPTRNNMFTCWDQKINARPGNFGSRIDYILYSERFMDWFCESDIQDGLMGSDHCPVYVILKQTVEINGKATDIKDIMSSGMFKNGIRQREWCTKDQLPLSAKLIPEFDRRRNIKEMFTGRATVAKKSLQANNKVKGKLASHIDPKVLIFTSEESRYISRPHLKRGEHDKETQTSKSCTALITKPDAQNNFNPEICQLKYIEMENESKNLLEYPQNNITCPIPDPITAKKRPEKRQRSLRSFFEVRSPDKKLSAENRFTLPPNTLRSVVASENIVMGSSQSTSATIVTGFEDAFENCGASFSNTNISVPKEIPDPIVARENWFKLLNKRELPLCEHNEPCISLVTRKSGINYGRSFYICSRPPGPSGQKEKNSPWRCSTFIWKNDWNRHN
ncbi:DNA lyase Apn2 [Golovinomyces cichoracearum]|uniref:DNA-(apurinic or apyrimidinic site) endonuclease 2 n=1 Tax=Golovinomyces cichoracearum TaxID=62708 RepID=A0A420HC46_9PEZI|nr:DNA lyase Apn2 [Golovinomyces cichoracearum]